MKFLSIITINYNNVEGLKLTLNSIISLIKSDFELIVVDGNSTDGAVPILTSQAFKIDQLIIENDNGIYDAMNKGLEQSKGEYVWFLNSGDIVHPNFDINSLIAFANEMKLPDVIYSDVSVKYENFSREKPTLPLQMFSNCLPFSHQAVIFKRKGNESRLFDTRLKLIADYHFFLKMYLNDCRFLKWDKPFSIITAGGRSEQNPRLVFKEKMQIAKEFKFDNFKKIQFFLDLVIRESVMKIKGILPKNLILLITKSKYQSTA